MSLPTGSRHTEFEDETYCFYCSETAHYECGDKNCQVPLCSQHATKIDTKLINIEDSGNLFFCPSCEIKLEPEFGLSFCKLRKDEDTDELISITPTEPTISEAIEAAAAEPTEHSPQRIVPIGNAWCTFNTKIYTATKSELIELLVELNQKVKNAEVVLTRRQIQKGTVQRELREREHIERLESRAKGHRIQKERRETLNVVTGEAAVAKIKKAPTIVSEEDKLKILKKQYPIASDDQLKMIMQMMSGKSA